MAPCQPTPTAVSAPASANTLHPATALTYTRNAEGTAHMATSAGSGSGTW
uniref:Uncharacterized protein n=1 Tax=Arundo donax TaxID=35708 RepID=A0A0A9HA13_ARUDO